MGKRSTIALAAAGALGASAIAGAVTGAHFGQKLGFAGGLGVSKAIYLKQVPNTKCKSTPHEVCTTVTDTKCKQVPQETCQQVPKQRCVSVPSEVCVSVPETKCRKE